jgi:NAD(P)-dependent dehydrogenase (short-subunit alcohol dehydrogenase family)
MDYQLKGKRAFVSGSTAGIGLAIARQFAGEGCEVIVNGRTSERVDKAIQVIRETHPNASMTGLVADFNAAESVQMLLDHLNPVDILVNNVGIFEPLDFTDIGDEEWYRFFEVNVMSGVRLSRHCFKHMIDQDWGRIIFIASESGVQIPGEMVHYGMTKAAQIAIANGLARATKGTNVTVNSVLSGSTWSEGAASFFAELAKKEGKEAEEVASNFVKTMRPSSLLERFATTDEVANLVTYLASPLSSATNGAALRVDGGTLPTIL